MKSMVCEMCGSNDIVKKDGLYVCQFCGTKYSVEDAKKMMIDGTVNVQGTVKIDKSETVQKNLMNARRTYADEDYEEAEKYYGIVMEDLPDNLEAMFFYTCCQLKATRNIGIFKKKANTLTNTIRYIGEQYHNSDDEKEMTFIGFVAFLDPPKKEVKSTIKKLKEYGITTKILTGDNQYATENICKLVGIEDSKILLGTDIDRMPDGELAKKVEEVNVFARMNPLQKERIIKALRKNGHVVGYMGDGVNDAPSLHNADVGICVNTATDIAKEASDIILLEKSLKVIFNGVIEGRKVYGNIIKYMKMALSSDFGDVFSIFIASIFLPFLPLLPIQMLIQDFLYDFSQIGIPYDNVDEEFLIKPRKWDTKGLGTFMNVMGPVSSIIDVLAFLAFWFILGYNGAVSESYFQTAWFVECLISETLIIHFVRTEKVPFVQSKANPILTCLTMVTIIGTIFTPILLHNIESFHFEIMPPLYYLIVAGLTILYVILVQIVKKIYIKKVGNWL